MLYFEKNLAFMLIALGVGYGVLCLAKRQDKGGLQFLGYFIGTLLIALAALLLIKDFILGATCPSGTMKKGKGKMMMQQEMMREQPPAK